MSPEAQRIAIAEACGWTDIPIVNGKYGQTDLPDYLNDLNAIHEAEKVLTNSADWSLCTYVLALHEMTSSWVFNATAAQRAEAFLRTIGKWEATK